MQSSVHDNTKEGVHCPEHRILHTTKGEGGGGGQINSFIVVNWINLKPLTLLSCVAGAILVLGSNRKRRESIEGNNVVNSSAWNDFHVI